ncbi:Uncharacterised protein [Mycobacteroides abscessus]|uniref:hypothetical protein n=1 Tax=Mycobacteroides abscessus TaxID=36809 RepID=UPI0005DDEEE9|nr:hypothetical protein [Mycobacteroides abscessus]MDO3130077.1 hypothetical protein [Mycobacteroides abscessus subsp. bolletii]MDO3311854.1 hypothetical protein [Mycobacteroides abscessus subsp. abscessus]MDO3345465.1 hypothetical protein [Mycobacteroides abscessus subsp. abscessus]CPT99198.1 Uncharacterised protein [Mycobacteroides abscessus]CPW04898.1 Uncharacterised protein [Mycobacteroides abscessus]
MNTGPSNHGWLRKWLRREPHQIIGGKDSPYLLRWYVIPRNKVVNVYLHKFLRSDDDRALHDHPWWFISLILKGGYTEFTENARTARSGLLGGRYRSWDRTVAFRPATFRHRVELWPAVEHVNPFITRRDRRELPCWTLIVTGPRTRLWGFWCKDRFGETRSRQYEVDRFIPWDEFGDAGCGER